MAHNWYIASGLIGGTDGCLDALDGLALADGDRAIVIIGDGVYAYILDADSGLTETLPSVISPDFNSESKRWILSPFFLYGLYFVSSLTGGSSGALDAIDGDLLKDGDKAFCFDSGFLSVYKLDGSSGATEDPPSVISPDDNAVDKRWILQPTFFPNTVYTNDAVISSTITTSIRSLAYGFGHTLEGCLNSGAIFGFENVLSNIKDSVILGGYSNGIYGDDNYAPVIVGSGQCFIYDAHESAVISGYQCNIVDGTNSSILSGRSNEFFDTNGSVLSGDHNVIAKSDSAAILSGDMNKICDMNYAHILTGEDGIIFPIATLSGQGAVILGGKDARASLEGQISVGAGKFSFLGDAQSYNLTYAVETTDAVATNIQPSLLICGVKTLKFRLHIVARQTAGSSGTIGDSAFWEITGGIKSVGGTAAQGTLTMASVPSPGESVTIGSMTFVFVPDGTNPTNTGYVSIGSTVSDCLDNLQLKVGKLCPFVSSSVVSNTLVFTAFDPGALSDDIAFSASASTFSVDGSGYLGGTTAAGATTVSFIGTPQGTGAPGANDRDTDAAVWEANVSASSTIGELVVSCTGDTNKTIHWVMKAEFVEVG